MPARDYYDVLGVPRTATADDIKGAYRKLARRYHPDVNKTDDAAARFSEVQQAYDVLSDPDQRARYDRVGHLRFQAGAAAGGGPADAHYTWRNVAGSPGGTFDVDLGDMGSMFDAIFGGRESFDSAPPRGRAAAARGPDVQRRVPVPFETAALGGTLEIPVDRDGRRRTVHLRVPQATVTGARHRVRGEGGPAPTPRGEAGDLIVELEVAPHAFLRRGRPGAHAGEHVLDLWLELPLSLGEAVEGAAIDVPVLDRTLTVKIPPGTGSGGSLRLGGGGLASADGKSRGDLYVVPRVIVPRAASLTKAERSALASAAAKAPAPRPWDAPAAG